MFHSSIGASAKAICVPAPGRINRQRSWKTVENLNPWYIDRPKTRVDTGMTVSFYFAAGAYRCRGPFQGAPMADKPSLYVVEKKEVIILVVLFVLVTVLSFTLGVRYGESVGKKLAYEQEQAAREIGGNEAEPGSGSLGKSAEHKDEAGSLEKSEKGEKSEKEVKIETGEKPEAKAEAPKARESHSPEEAAKGTHVAPGASRGNVDKNSDEYLLNALKDAGVEAPGGKAPKDAELPAEVKEAPAKAPSRARSGSYVIQVGSHPTENEANAQVRSLQGHHVAAEILAPFKDKQGEWHRVVISGFRSKKEADKEAVALKVHGSIASYFIWRLP
jgi:cell division protein FtsN